ncbi:MAG: hypothetical protein ACJ72Q_07030, partial [Nitrososphaeraceae archaeon]
MPKRNLLLSSISTSTVILSLVLICLITANRASSAYAAAEQQQYSMVGKWGSRGSGNGKLSQPLDIAIDTSGNVYVGDFGNAQIQKFTSNGTFITSWGQLGFGNGLFTNPAG